MCAVTWSHRQQVTYNASVQFSWWRADTNPCCEVSNSTHAGPGQPSCCACRTVPWAGSVSPSTQTHLEVSASSQRSNFTMDLDGRGGSAPWEASALILFYIPVRLRNKHLSWTGYMGLDKDHSFSFGDLLTQTNLLCKPTLPYNPFHVFTNS